MTRNHQNTKSSSPEDKRYDLPCRKKKETGARWRICFRNDSSMTTRTHERSETLSRSGGGTLSPNLRYTHMEIKNPLGHFGFNFNFGSVPIYNNLFTYLCIYIGSSNTNCFSMLPFLGVWPNPNKTIQNKPVPGRTKTCVRT